MKVDETIKIYCEGEGKVVGIPIKGKVSLIMKFDVVQTAENTRLDK